jgi:hypothetical protein
MRNYEVYFPSALLLTIVSCGQQEAEETRRPNILFAISDDQSFAHTSIAGSRFVNTPAFRSYSRGGRLFCKLLCGFTRLCAITERPGYRPLPLAKRAIGTACFFMDEKVYSFC